jgi:PHD/YefM family antitoxin component YafN of YafNO toxin-antitoxin module
MPESIQYITDNRGKKTSVILPIAEYEQLMEDLEDLACVAERRYEESVPFEDVLKRLKVDGLVPDHG